ncbi:hypothetical protein L7F22_018258 [Adiantum nelumboides]|nr:hypothetical protein [Adiantum nelumboides]
MAPSSKADTGLVFSGAVTNPAPASRSSKPRIGGSPGTKTGTPTPQHVQMELKQRILVALGRLADRDTQQIGIEELDKLVETISPDCVAVFLSCLYDSEMQQKSVVKKECVRLFSSLAALHADLLVPHLTKIIASIMRRLRDPDSSVRDSCVEAIASLSARMLCPPTSSSSGLEKENGTQNASALTLATFSKPLFDALSEQNKSVQTGAALCLARVIESAKSPPVSALSRLCPRICKFMSNPNFLARSALLGVVGSLSQVGALNQQQLALVMPCVYEALESNDWATRKAAAETLGRVGTNLGPALSSFKTTTLQVLETTRFDKVKPVRDSISDATQVWKNLPDGAELGVSMQRLELHSHTENSFTATKSPGNGNKVESSPNQLANSSEKPLEAVKKRVHLLTDKKLNPEFFQKLAAKDPDDWQVEVAVPRSFPPQKSQDELGVTEGHLENSGSLPEQLVAVKNTPGQRISSNGKGNDLTSPGTRSLTADEIHSLRTHGSIKSSCRDVLLDRSTPKNTPYTDLDESGCGIELSSNGLHLASSEMSKFNVIQKRLIQLEQQQSSLLRMIQDIMVSSQENMSVLKARIWDLENVVESLVGDVGFAGSKNFKAAALGVENNGVRLPGRFTAGSEYANSRFNKSGDASRLYTDKVNGLDVMSKPLQHNGQKFSDTSLDDWDEFSYRGPLAGVHVLDIQTMARRPSEIMKVEREDTGASHSGIRRLWDRVPGAVRLGEGPSARSVWQASKDEATLAAIRVAGEDSEHSEIDANSTAALQLVLADSEIGGLRHKAANGYEHGKGQYWSLWSSAMEFVQAGDMESAYTEVLCAEDERMLVRLMSRTGPVLDQLTVTTASEVLRAIGALLQHQSYFDFCLCWIQQAADIMADNGSDCLDISLDAKKELLMALQETSSMALPDGWLGSSIDELLQQLALAWSIDMEPGEAEL